MPHAPWPDLRQVEQDLIICRALCDLFSSEQLQERSLFAAARPFISCLFEKPLRYSEDIDLVQTQAEPIGTTIDGDTPRPLLARKIQMGAGRSLDASGIQVHSGG